jgi:hypothetical protein
VKSLRSSNKVPVAIAVGENADFRADAVATGAAEDSKIPPVALTGSVLLDTGGLEGSRMTTLEFHIERMLHRAWKNGTLSTLETPDAAASPIRSLYQIRPK